jgi:hypothetical protein
MGPFEGRRREGGVIDLAKKRMHILFDAGLLQPKDASERTKPATAMVYRVNPELLEQDSFTFRIRGRTSTTPGDWSGMQNYERVRWLTFELGQMHSIELAIDFFECVASIVLDTIRDENRATMTGTALEHTCDVRSILRELEAMS